MTWWHYLVLVNFYLVLFYGFYVLLLQRETFFQLNRLYLVAASILSFLIPVIHSNWVQNLFITQRVQYTLYSSPVVTYHFKPIEDTHINMGQVFSMLYLAGIAFLTIRLIVQLVQLNNIIRQPRQATSFSFFNRIKLGENVTNSDVITAHEQAHARQWHSVDVMIIEVVMILNWFNPVVYFYRLAIKHIHEFIADKHAIISGTSRSDYALLLLSQTFNTPTHQLVNHFFNKSLLKRRILMLQKGNSRKVALAKYGLSAPMFILMLVLSSATVNNSKAITIISKKANTVFLTPAGDAISGITNAQIPDDLFDEVSKTTVKKKTVVYAHNNLQEASISTSGKVFDVVERRPEFPGGMTAFFRFIGETLKYPAAMRENNVQGKAYISFIIEKDGSISDVRSLRDPGYGAGEEAVRTISLSPRWNPGIQNGQPIRVQFTVPINFSLAGDDSKQVKLPLDTNKLFAASKPSSLEPLILVNGSEYSENLKTISPDKIQSIEILKDRSTSTYVAIYGAKALNGVILVTLKK
ncbi:MAG: TonB family protein [Mucilaginibacter sp.]